MDLDDIVDAWIDHAITQHEVPPPNQSRGHYNITYALYLCRAIKQGMVKVNTLTRGFILRRYNGTYTQARGH